ncbi:tyrosine-type recombinase/integrase [Desulfonatronum parangueonense]
MPNTNHPKKGSSTKVEPIRRLEDIKAIKKLLSDKPRDLLLFTMGINNGLRIGDLLQLRVKDVQHLQPGEPLTVKEQKTGKTNVLLVNKTTHKVLQEFLRIVQPEPEAFLFQSHKAKGKPLTVSAANRLIDRFIKIFIIKRCPGRTSSIGTPLVTHSSPVFLS